MGCCKLTGGGVSISSVSGELLPESLSVPTYTTVNVLVAQGAISTSAHVCGGHEHVNQKPFIVDMYT